MVIRVLTVRICSTVRPKFVSIKEAAKWLEDQEPVLAFSLHGDARAYPLQIPIRRWQSG